MKTCLVSKPRVENDFSTIFDSFFNLTPFNGNHLERQSAFSPKVNIIEDDDSINMMFELPGMKKSDIKVLVKDSMLTVSGERKFEKEEKSDNFVRSEISTGSFSRSFNLPDTVLTDNVLADYKNGLLQISLLKREEVKPKEIEIKVS